MIPDRRITHADRTTANFATVRWERCVLAGAAAAQATRRPQLLRFLQQLPLAQPDRAQLLHIPQQLDGPRSVIRNLRITAARLQAEQEYDKYQRQLDTLPSPVEQHFDEAIKKAKQLERPKKAHKNPGDKQ